MSYTKEQRAINSVLGGTKESRSAPATQETNNFVLPNKSGEHVRSIKRETPVSDVDLVNKKYVDDEIASEQFWQRVGTLISPKTAGDNITTSGYLKSTKATDCFVSSNNSIAITPLAYVGTGTGLAFDTTNGKIQFKALTNELLYSSATETSILGNFYANQSGKISYQNHAASQPTRALDTVYQNTTGHPIIVYGSLFIGTDDMDSWAYGILYTDSSNPPTTKVQQVGEYFPPFGFGLTKDAYYPFYMVVQKSHYYKITTSVQNGGVVTLDKWNEVNF